MKNTLEENRLEKIAFAIIKDLNKKFPKYDAKKTSDFNKVISYFKDMMPKASLTKVGQIALDYHDYRGGDMGVKIPAIKKMSQTMKKIGMKEAKMSDKDMYDYLMYMRKYKPDIWRDLQGNKKVKKIMKKFESVNENIDTAYDKTHDALVQMSKALQKHGNQKAIRAFKKWWDQLDRFYPEANEGLADKFMKNLDKYNKKAKKSRDAMKKLKKKEGVNEIAARSYPVYQFKGFTNKDMDELDAHLSRNRIKGKPDFNKMTWTVKKFPPGWASYDQKQLDYYMLKSKGGKKIKESVNIGEEVDKYGHVHAKSKKELKAAMAKAMKTILSGKVPKFQIINGRTGEMIGWPEKQEYHWQPPAIPDAERELK
tara:strand:+ start:1099 stop:2202 length:1104 start_codon:yes stop_codon:yes gene_type:complete